MVVAKLLAVRNGCPDRFSRGDAAETAAVPVGIRGSGRCRGFEILCPAALLSGVLSVASAGWLIGHYSPNLRRRSVQQGYFFRESFGKILHVQQEDCHLADLWEQQTEGNPWIQSCCIVSGFFFFLHPEKFRSGSFFRRLQEDLLPGCFRSVECAGDGYGVFQQVRAAFFCPFHGFFVPPCFNFFVIAG